MENIEKTVGFGEAIEHLKKGCKICRKGWNGKGMFVFLRKGGPYVNGWSNDEMVLKTATTGVFQPGWNASTADVLAHDWILMPDKFDFVTISDIYRNNVELKSVLEDLVFAFHDGEIEVPSRVRKFYKQAVKCLHKNYPKSFGDRDMKAWINEDEDVIER